MAISEERALDGILLAGVVYSIVMFLRDSSLIANLLLPNCKIFLVCVCGLIITRVRLPDFRRMSFPVLFAISLLLVYLLAWFTTSQIEFGVGKLGGGYGDDGLYYGRMTENFAWFKNTEIAPYCYRILPSLLVHLSGLNTFTGFHILNFSSFVGSSIFMFRILRFYEVPERLALAGTLFLSTLKFGLKFWIYYPVLTDGLGTMLLMGIIYFTLTKRHILYAFTLCLAVYCRENLLSMIPFYLIYNLRSNNGTARWKLFVIQLLPLGVFYVSRTYPVFSPAEKFSYSQMIFFWLHQFVAMPQRHIGFLVAHFNALGILIVVPFFVIKEFREFLKANPEWIYFAGVTFVLSVVGGSDMDRFITWQAPLLITALLVSEKHELTVQHLWIPLLVIQMIAMELFLPWFSKQTFYLTRYAVYSIYRLQMLMMLFSFFMAIATWRIYKSHTLAPRR